MSLPYPPELEQDALGPAPGPPTSPALQTQVAALVRQCEARICVADRPLHAADRPQEALPVLQRAILQRLAQRRPNLDAKGWRILYDRLNQQLASHSQLDSDAWRTIKLTIDGL